MLTAIIISLTVIINITLAQIDANRIKDGKRIYHGVNGLVYFIMLVGVWLLTHNPWAVSVAICLRLIVFNISLNLFRHLPPLYIPLAPKSMVDRLVKPIGRWVYALYLIGLIISIYCL